RTSTESDRSDGTTAYDHGRRKFPNAEGRMSLLSQYLERIGDRSPDPAPTALYAMLDHVATVSPSVAAAIVHEFNDQRTNLKLIASQNYSSLATQLAQGTQLTEKYAECDPAHRIHAGCAHVDDRESEARRRACAT